MTCLDKSILGLMPVMPVRSQFAAAVPVQLLASGLTGGVSMSPETVAALNTLSVVVAIAVSVKVVVLLPTTTPVVFWQTKLLPPDNG